MKTRSWESIRRDLLKNPEFRKAYDELGPEFELIEAIIEARIRKNMTQAQLAKKVGTKQSAISRLEGGNSNPSLAFLRKVAKALGTELRISFS